MLIFFAALLGACFASFLAVVVERVPRGESLNGRSHCVCGRTLGPVELIPVVSYLLAAGRARCCGVRIPRRLVLGEIAAATAAGVGAAAFGVTGAALLGGLALAVIAFTPSGE